MIISPLPALATLALALALTDAPAPSLRPDPPIACASCAEWNAPREPFRLFGNSYYVGVAGLSAVLITSDQGHILLDGGLPQSASLIDGNIRKLGFCTQDVHLILNSHAHFDHAGGIAALQRTSRAVVAASAAGARALSRGEPTDDDPQFAFGHQANAFPPVQKVKVVQDREVVRVGPIAVTAHLTPGHTPGSTTWSWRSCEQARCLNVVYADSLNPVSAPGYRFGGEGASPGISQAFRQSIAKVAALPCDLIVSVHPSFTDLDDKQTRRAAQPAGPDPFINPKGCQAYAADAARRLDKRLLEESRPAP